MELSPCSTPDPTTYSVAGDDDDKNKNKNKNNNGSLQTSNKGFIHVVVSPSSTNSSAVSGPYKPNITDTEADLQIPMPPPPPFILETAGTPRPGDAFQVIILVSIYFVLFCFCCLFFWWLKESANFLS